MGEDITGSAEHATGGQFDGAKKTNVPWWHFHETRPNRQIVMIFF